jgi:hypothetical protein
MHKSEQRERVAISFTTDLLAGSLSPWTFQFKIIRSLSIIEHAVGNPKAMANNKVGATGAGNMHI